MDIVKFPEMEYHVADLYKRAMGIKAQEDLPADFLAFYWRVKRFGDLIECGNAFAAPPRAALLCAFWTEMKNLQADLCVDYEPVPADESPPSQPEPDSEEESGDEEEEEASELPEPETPHPGTPVTDESPLAVEPPSAAVEPPTAAKSIAVDGGFGAPTPDPKQNPLGL